MPSFVALIALAGGLAIYFAHRRRQLAPLPPAEPRRPPPPPGPKIVSEGDDDTGFIENLKRQEQSLDDLEPGSWRREPEIIDAEYVELIETNEE